MDEFTEVQPMDGETILHCDHAPSQETNHWLFVQGVMHFVRPDGSTGSSRWICLCDGCLGKYDESKSLEGIISGDGKWAGNAAFIRKTERSQELPPPSGN